MNEGIAQRTDTSPFTSPAPVPTPRQASTARGSGQCQRVSPTPSTAAPKAITEPIERSMPAATSTSVIPTALTVSAGI